MVTKRRLLSYTIDTPNYLLRLTCSEPVCKELLRDTFVALWWGAPRLERRAKVRTWIFYIARNKAVSWLRRHRPLSL
jgi:DNA-directed RNA polymerase specialized sigma24 family protein